MQCDLGQKEGMWLQFKLHQPDIPGTLLQGPSAARQIFLRACTNSGQRSMAVMNSTIIMNFGSMI